MARSQWCTFESYLETYNHDCFTITLVFWNVVRLSCWYSRLQLWFRSAISFFLQSCDTFANMQIFVSSLLFCKSKTAVVKYFRINQHKGILPVMKNNKLLVKYFSTQFWWTFALAVGANLVRSWPMVNEKADHCNQNVPSDRYDSCECVSLTCFNFWLVFRLVQAWVQSKRSSMFIVIRIGVLLCNFARIRNFFWMATLPPKFKEQHLLLIVA